MATVTSDIVDLKQSHIYDHDTIINYLETNRKTGLSAKEAKKRLQVQKNVIATKKESLWKVYIAPFMDTLITIYIIMIFVLTLLSLIVPETRGTILWWFIFIGANIVLAIYQQYRARKKVEALKKLSPPKANVIREGLQIQILAQDLVPGDIVELNLGDRVPADARLLETAELYINEASLTGEGIPVRKFRDPERVVTVDTSIAERKNMVYLGTFVQSGKGLAVVTSTGNDTEIGSIASTMSDMQTLEIPLRSRINTLGRTLGIIMVMLLVINLIVRLYFDIIITNKITVKEIGGLLARSIINAMAVIPMNIPLLSTIVLITGVLNMAKKSVVVKDLAVVETLGRTSVLCSDKTGTMTTSEMSVVKIWDTTQFYDVHHDNNFGIYKVRNQYQEDATVLTERLKITSEEVEYINTTENNGQLNLLIKSGILNNYAKLVDPGVSKTNGMEKYKIAGNATDGAIIKLGIIGKMNIKDMIAKHTRVKEYPFNSELKRMSGLFEDEETGKLYVYSKGATEVLLPLCNRIQSGPKTKRITKKQKEQVNELVNQFAKEGYRVISIAYKPVKEGELSTDSEDDRDSAENNLVYLGFVSLLDPPRQGVDEAVSKLNSAGIFPIMITGDSAVTAATIARNVGVLDADEIVVEGKDIKNLTDEQFFKTSVFARVSPQDKQVIVDKYQKQAKVVAMTGDGVNDALAITLADAGVAMGKTGTDVAKEASDIIIVDDSYVSLVNGVEEGRNLFEKIRMVIFFFIAVNVAEAIVFFSTFFFMDYFLTDTQRVYIAFIVHGFPSLALVFGTNDKSIMQLKPREHDAILPTNLVKALLIFSLSFAAILLLVYFSIFNESIGFLGINAANQGGHPLPIGISDQDPINLAQAKARTVFVTIAYLAESLLVISIKRINLPPLENLKELTRLEWAVIMAPFIFHLLVMYLPFLQVLSSNFFDVQLMVLSFVDLLVVIVIALLPLLLLEAYKAYVRNRGQQF